MKKTFLAFGFSICALFVLAQANNNGFSVQTTTQNGIIEGNYDTKSGIQTYFGIPFAKPPVGDLRWKDPQPITSWKGVKETKKFGPRPMQVLIWDDMNSRSNGVSEDCLYLNVWTPANRNTKNLPVLVYFYGGGNVAGDGSEPRYDGETMAKKGIVVITCNYRLNIFGNFSHPELSAESPHKSSGNYGYYDQLAALQWVKNNIAAFGGDPNHVTIAGESAGSVAVSYQMSSPLAKGLVNAAIGESGAGIAPTMAPVSLQEAEKAGKIFADKAGATSLKALRALTSREVYEIYAESKGEGRFPVVLDGYFLPKYLSEIYIAKEQSQIPLLVGWNSAEGSANAILMGQPYTVENYINKVKEAYPNNANEFLAVYAAHSEKEVEQAATALAGDKFIGFSTWKWFDLHRKNSNQPVYRYLYSKLRPALVGASAPAHAAGAPHAAEIEYCMGNLRLIKEFAWTADDYQVSETMNNYFANFIKTYNPNGKNLPEWKVVTANDPTPPVMVIDVKSRTEKAVNDARYELLDKLYKNK